VLIRVPVVLPDGERPLSLNLKGPIVLAPRRRAGIQRISADESHALRFVPADTGTPSCSS
jgi:hypothetical protein